MSILSTHSITIRWFSCSWVSRPLRTLNNNQYKDKPHCFHTCLRCESLLCYNFHWYRIAPTYCLFLRKTMDRGTKFTKLYHLGGRKKVMKTFFLPSLWKKIETYLGGVKNMNKIKSTEDIFPPPCGKKPGVGEWKFLQ